MRSSAAKLLVGVPVLSRNFLPMGVQVVDIRPIDFAALRGQAVCVDCSMDCPRVHFVERVILVNKANLIFVVIERGGKERLVHAGTIGAFQVVEVDHGDLCIGVASNRPARGVDRECGIFIEIKLFQACQGFAIGRDQEVIGSCLCSAREGHGQRFIAGDLAWLACANGHRIVLRHVELRPNQDFDVPVDGSVRSGLIRGLRLAAKSEAQCEQADQKSKTRQM